MTARDFIASLAPVDLDRQATIFRYMAEHAYELRLADGKLLRGVPDFKQYLRELAAAAEGGEPPKKQPRGLCRATEVCPRCGHVHEGDRECGEQMGGGRICRCEMEVEL